LESSEIRSRWSRQPMRDGRSLFLCQINDLNAPTASSHQHRAPPWEITCSPWTHGTGPLTDDSAIVAMYRIGCDHEDRYQNDCSEQLQNELLQPMYEGFFPAAHCAMKTPARCAHRFGEPGALAAGSTRNDRGRRGAGRCGSDDDGVHDGSSIRVWWTEDGPHGAGRLSDGFEFALRSCPKGSAVACRNRHSAGHHRPVSTRSRSAGYLQRDIAARRPGQFDA
jgi:hypothetical protein